MESSLLRVNNRRWTLDEYIERRSRVPDKTPTIGDEVFIFVDSGITRAKVKEITAHDNIVHFTVDTNVFKSLTRSTVFKSKTSIRSYIVNNLDKV